MEYRYEDEQMMVIHQSAQGLFRLGVIDAAKMREFDEACLESAVRTPSAASYVEKPSATRAYASKG